MAEFALRADDGDIHPEQAAYVDGYGIEERLLEGVRFKVERMVLGTGHQLVCHGVHPGDHDYMLKFNKRTLESYYRKAVRLMTEDDMDATAEDGTNVHWGDA